MGIPDGWNDYDRVGKQVHGTRFIAFKVPLKEGINNGSRVPEEKQLYPKLLVELVPSLGLVIDLTNTKKYYNPDEFLALGVAYQKIYVEGHVIPSNQCSAQFRDTVKAFLAENENNDKLIGVHCTHGLNRSGFLVCRFMIEEMNIPPLEAIAAFEIARGHKMERENYINKLKRLTVNDGASSRIPKKEKLPSLAIDTEHDKGCQTNRGFWINETSIPPYHRSSTTGSLDMPEHSKKQVSLIGCVNVQKRDLIPDGRGGYFVHITKKEIQHREMTHRNDSNNSHEPQRYHQRFPDNHRIPYGISSTPQKRRAHVPPNRPYNQQRPRHNHGDHSMVPQSYQLPPQYFSQPLPMSGNNLAEDLLALQNMNRNPYGY